MDPQSYMSDFGFMNQFAMNPTATSSAATDPTGSGSNIALGANLANAFDLNSVMGLGATPATANAATAALANPPASAVATSSAAPTTSSAPVTSSNANMNMNFMNMNNTNAMMDFSNTFTSTPASSTGMIEMPAELNSPPKAPNAPTSVSATTTSGAPAVATNAMANNNAVAAAAAAAAMNAIPFPASLSNDGNPLNGLTSMDLSMATMNPAASTGFDINQMNKMFMNPSAAAAAAAAAAYGMPPHMQTFNPQVQAQFYLQQQQQQQQYMRMIQQQHQQNNLLLQQHQQQLRQQAMIQANELATKRQQQQQQQQQQKQQQQQQPAAMNAASNGMGLAQPAQPGVSSAAPTTTTAAPSGTSDGSWRSQGDHTALRSNMVEQILRFMKAQTKSSNDPSWLRRLPEMAKRLEDSLFQNASSREEYSNLRTLGGRLKNIARSLHGQQRKSSSSGSTPVSASQAPLTTSTPAPTATTTPQTSATIQGGMIPFPGDDLPTQTSSSSQSNGSSATSTASPKTGLMSQAIAMPKELQDAPVTTLTPQVKETSSAGQQANPLHNGGASPGFAQRNFVVDATFSPLPGSVGLQPNDPNANNPAAIAASRNKSAQFIRHFKERAQQVTATLDDTISRDYHMKLQSMSTADAAKSRSVLQKQQQRLLLLRHAMWCKASEGSCTATPSCGEMRRLWQHMSACQNTTTCSYSHCTSSKYVLSHFQQCSNAKCQVCQLVRFPLEVKDKSGVLMMDVERATQQLIIASQKRHYLQQQHQLQQQQQQQQQQQRQQQQQQQQQLAAQQQQLQQAQLLQQQQQLRQQQLQQLQQQRMMQQTQALSMPTATMTTSAMTSSQAFMGPAASVMNASAPVSTMMSTSGPTSVTTNMARPVTSGQPVSADARLQGTPVSAKTTPVTATTPTVPSGIPNDRTAVITKLNAQALSLTEEDRRQVLIVAEKMGMLPVEVLGTYCKKLESKAELIRHQMNSLVNERRQLLHNASSSEDANVRNAHQMQANTKAQQLKDWEAKYKLCNSHYKALQFIMASKGAGIDAKTIVAPLVKAAVASANAATSQAPQTQSVPQQQQQPPAPGSTPLNQPKPTAATPQTSAASPAIDQQPLAMPPDLKDPIVKPEPVVSQSQPVAIVQKTELVATKAGVADMSLEAPKQEVKEEQREVTEFKLESKAIPPGAFGMIGASAAGSAGVMSERTPNGPGNSPPAEVSTSMLSELSNEDLKKHIDSLVKYYNATLSPLQLKKKLEILLKGMMEHKFGWVFSSPVDPVALGIPNYFNVIRRPMDLGTVKKKLDAGIYKTIHHFAKDVRLTFSNAMLYNDEEQDVYNLAKDMLSDFNAEVRKAEAEVQEEEQKARARENACRLCGSERMVFEPAVLYCNGECNSRIRRNSYFYCSEDNKYHCCHTCYAGLPDTIRSSEGKNYQKKELTRKKNDEVHEEPWVQCDKCERWVHQICALFNGKIDAERKPASSTSSTTTTSTTGPTDKSNKSTSNGSASSGPSSSQMTTTSGGSEFLCPECLLEWRQKDPQTYKISKHAFNARDLMRTKLSDYLERRITKALKEEREDEAKWSRRDVKKVLTAENLTIRQVSNIEKQLMVRDKMYTRYKESHKYPSEFRFKSKCICMFQEIDGVSVLLFGMYVHEFDEVEAECNSRRVYISYLDSVNYFEPPHLRTKVYHELLIAYLDFVKQRGFHTAHLWACPPLKGDDYILYCHPESQKTPKSDRLRQWYVDMLVKAQKEGIVWHITNMYDDYWRNDNTACSLPYFEGDYWVGLAEDLIEKIDTEKPKKSKKGVKRKIPPSKKQSKKSKKKNKRRKTASTTSASSSTANSPDVDDEDTVDESDDEEGGSKKENRVVFSDKIDKTVTDALMLKLGEVIEPMKDDFLVVKLQPYCRVCNKPTINGKIWLDSNTKTDIGLNPKTVQYALCDNCYTLCHKARAQQQASSSSSSGSAKDPLNSLVALEMHLPEKCTDPDEINDSEFFDTRQAFLSLCQGNHYQFDELRRAKHSSMMALYHLGNPNPNAYVYECNKCTKDIVSGNRWHCHTCPDFDVCDACYQKEKHEHPLECIPTSGTKGGTEEQRRLREKRAKNVRLHLQLLVHSSSCVAGNNCTSSNCEKMKELMRHGASCKQRATGGCTICRRVWALLQLHARQCRLPDCRVPRCHDLREHVRKLQLQQQLMDDRRRAAVTEQYRQLQHGGAHDHGHGSGNPSVQGSLPASMAGATPSSAAMQQTPMLSSKGHLEER